MINGISGDTDLLPQPSSSQPLTELAQVIAVITSPLRGELLYNSDTLLQHINTLVTETTGNLHTWCREYTPDMQATLTSSCNVVTSLVPLVKYSPQLKRYPEAVTQAIANELEHLCLEFHRRLYQFFPEDYQLPASYLKMEAHNANIQYRRLLADHPDNLLVKAMLRPVHKFIYQPSRNNTKARVDYITVLLGNIKLWHRKKGTQEQLYEIALTMNLNCPRLLQHMAGEASARILQYEKKTERLEYIEQLRKQCRYSFASVQWKPSPHGSYLPNESPVGIYINEWLNNQADQASEEIRLASETPRPADAVQQPEEELVRSEMKEAPAFFSILIRIMVAAGLTKLQKFAPILRSFSRVISFSKAGAPSSGHLITLASSRVSDAILDKLEAFFNECLLIIRKIRRNGGKFPDDVVKAEKT